MKKKPFLGIAEAVVIITFFVFYDDGKTRLSYETIKNPKNLTEEDAIRIFFYSFNKHDYNKALSLINAINKNLIIIMVEEGIY